MFKYITKNVDTFGKNVLLVFLGTSLANFLNLLYQLIIAHHLTPADFAAFNSLLAIFMLMTTPLAALQMAIVKYTSEFNAKKQNDRVCGVLSIFLKRTFIAAALVSFVFYLVSSYTMDKLNINSVLSGYILAVLLGVSWVSPVFMGGLQGLELFNWLALISVITGVIKLLFTYVFLSLKFNITGALGALLISVICGLIISYLPLKKFIFSSKISLSGINFKEIIFYALPVAISSFCFIAMVSFDMVLVKYFFSPEESGFYSLAQMLGKIILFLPGAIALVMFPRTSGLSAANLDATSTLSRSLLYTGILCIITSIVYNLFPAAILNMLTGKSPAKAILLGRLFSISMTFFAMVFILTTYLLSKKDLRCIKYLIVFTLSQVLAIVVFHKTLIQVQVILCVSASLLFFIHLFLAYKIKRILLAR